ncbi:MAG: FAD binding domain-containing protein [Myxococcota bacterium]
MLRLPLFEHHTPDSLDAALHLLGEFRAAGQEVKLIAGGTDLLPNMKHELHEPAHLISLAGLGLCEIEQKDGVLEIGAMTPVQSVADHRLVQQHLPALAEACAQIAGPQLRRMGTLGGNICLDTRCLYINQSYFWRSALGFCIKKDGTACHVVAGGRNCVAAASNDSALPLILYGAELHLVGPGGERQLPIEQFYVNDGVKNTVLGEDEILVKVIIPIPAPRTRASFEKLRVRRSIDFPLLNVAVLTETDNDNLLLRLDMVISALGARPKRINLDKAVSGKKFDSSVIEEAGRKAFNVCRPLTNLATDPQWRRSMVPQLVKRALGRLQDNSNL